MNRRQLRLQKYGITDSRQKELCGFCEQYPEWKEKLSEMQSNMKGIEYTDMPIYHTNADTTMKLAIKRSELSDKCELIETTAEEAGGVYLGYYIIRSVCYRVPFEKLKDIDGMACSKAAFYDARRYFFWLLDQRKR